MELSTHDCLVLIETTPSNIAYDQFSYSSSKNRVAISCLSCTHTYLCCGRITRASSERHDGEYTCEVSNSLCGQTESASTRVQVVGMEPSVRSEYTNFSLVNYRHII